MMCVLVSCSEDTKKPPPTPTDSQPATITGKKEPTTTSVEASAERAPKAFVAKWADHQNRGDYPGYEAVYSADFKGIKRAGKNEKSFDRAAWMKDRARMFKKRMRVEVADIEVKKRGPETQLTFTQTWESGSYKDRGLKRLTVTNAGGFAIVGEEMLTSDRLKVPKAVPDRAPSLLLVTGTTPPVVVTEIGAPSSAETGPPVMLGVGSGDEDLFVAGRKLKGSYSPKLVKAWQKKKLRLHGGNGLACTATVTGLYNASVVWPDARGGHFMYVEDDRKASAKNVWTYVIDQTEGMANRELHISNARLTVASLKLDRKSCKGALWARDAELPPLETLRAGKVPKSLAARARRALRKMKSYNAKWEKAETLKWKSHLLKGGGRTFLSTTFVADADSCDENQQGGSLTALWEVVTWKGKAVLVQWTNPEIGENPPRAGALASDGEPIFVSGLADDIDGALWGRIGAVHRPFRSLGAFVVAEDALRDCPDDSDDEDGSDDEDAE